jgi:hypothetical protein
MARQIIRISHTTQFLVVSLSFTHTHTHIYIARKGFLRYLPETGRLDDDAASSIMYSHTNDLVRRDLYDICVEFSTP